MLDIDSILIREKQMPLFSRSVRKRKNNRKIQLKIRRSLTIDDQIKFPIWIYLE